MGLINIYEILSLLTGLSPGYIMSKIHAYVLLYFMIECSDYEI